MANLVVDEKDTGFTSYCIGLEIVNGADTVGIIIFVFVICTLLLDRVIIFYFFGIRKYHRNRSDRQVIFNLAGGGSGGSVAPDSSPDIVFHVTNLEFADGRDIINIGYVPF